MSETSTSPRHPAISRILFALVLIGSLLTGAAWSVSSPVGSSPDEVFHLGSIWCAQGDSATCKLPTNASGWRQVAKVPAFIAGSACFRKGDPLKRPYNSAACQSAIPKVPTLADATINHAGGYPGGFYRVMSTFVTSSITNSVIVMRLVNVLLFTALLACAMLFLRPRFRQSVLLTAAIGLVPIGFFLTFSVNPSSWALMGVLFYWVFLAALVSAEKRSLKTVIPLSVLTVATAALAINSRSDSALYIGVVSVAVAIQYLSRDFYRRVELLIPIIVSVWGAMVYLGSSQIAEETNAHAASGLKLLVLNFVDMPLWIFGNFGVAGPPEWPLGLSWFDVPVPVVVPSLVILILGGVLFASLGKWGWRKSLAFWFTFGMTILLPLVAMQRRGMSGIHWMQPRYLLPLLLVSIAIALTMPNDDKQLVAHRSQRWVIIAGLSLAMGASQYVLIRRFVTGINGDFISLTHGAQWWWSSFPLSPDMVWGLGTLAALLLYFAVFTYVSRTTRELDLPESVEAARSR